MEFLHEVAVLRAMLLVISLILVDAVFGVFKALKEKIFDFRKLPAFVAANIFPYIGGLVVIGILAEYVGEPYRALFYLIAVFVGGKYLAEIKDKVAALFGMEGKV